MTGTCNIMYYFDFEPRDVGVLFFVLLLQIFNLNVVADINICASFFFK